MSGKTPGNIPPSISECSLVGCEGRPEMGCRKSGSEKRRTVRPASLRQKSVPLAKMSASRRGRSDDGNPGTYSVCLDAPLRGMPTLAVSFQRSFSSVVGADIAAAAGRYPALVRPPR
jgi:hypothetical protein